MHYKASLAATKEEKSAHPFLQGEGNTTEGFEVHRANFLLLLGKKTASHALLSLCMAQSFDILIKYHFPP